MLIAITLIPLIALAAGLLWRPARALASGAELLRAAAEAGDRDARYHLGWALQHGHDVEADLLEAAKWYRLAADDGHPQAADKLEALLASPAYQAALTGEPSPAPKVAAPAGQSAAAKPQADTSAAAKPQAGQADASPAREAKVEPAVATPQGPPPVKPNRPLTTADIKIVHPPAAAEDCEASLADDPEEDKRFEDDILALGRLPETVEIEEIHMGLAGTDSRKFEVTAARFLDGLSERQPLHLLNAALKCERGELGARDRGAARRWLRRAAEAGSLASHTLLGLMLASGRGGSRDLVGARLWLRRSAKLGEGWAMLGLWYLGRRDPSIVGFGESVFWLAKSIIKGVSQAEWEMSRLLEVGEIITKDVKNARRFLETAAEKGLPQALNDPRRQAG